MVERLSAGKPDKRKRRRLQPRRAVYTRLARQELGKLRFLPADVRPSEMTFGRFFNSAHVSIARRYIYVKNDKVGSSFIVRSLNASEKKARGFAFRTPFLDRHRHPLLTPAELTRSEWNEALADYFTFTFSRNPFSRILSCYLDRIVGRDESYHRLRQRFGFADTHMPSFAEFLDMLAEDGVIDLDTHWKPQYRNVAVDYYDYSFIGHFEYFREEFWQVLKMLYGRDTRMGAIREGTSATRQLRDYFNDRTADLVGRLYGRDFALFGYDPSSPVDIHPRQRNSLARLRRRRPGRRGPGKKPRARSGEGES